jgi:hypothetical protein
MNRKQIQKEAFNKGRRAGIWTALNYIVPIPIEGMNQRLLNAVAMALGIPSYSRMTQEELIQAIKDRGVNKASFKNDQGRAQLITK